MLIQTLNDGLPEPRAQIGLQLPQNTLAGPPTPALKTSGRRQTFLGNAVQGPRHPRFLRGRLRGVGESLVNKGVDMMPVPRRFRGTLFKKLPGGKIQSNGQAPDRRKLRIQTIPFQGTEVRLRNACAACQFHLAQPPIPSPGQQMGSKGGHEMYIACKLYIFNPPAPGERSKKTSQTPNP